jgi:hypothetical protein
MNCFIGNTNDGYSSKKSPIITRSWMQYSKSQNELDIDEGLNLF